jgi:hypothetical protein
LTRCYGSRVRPIPETGIARLMFYIQHRLAQLQWSREDLAEAGGPSPATLYKAHRAKREFRPRTAARLEMALAWEPGSAQRIIDGGVPSLRVSEQLETAAGYIDGALARGENVGVRLTAAQLRDFLMTVVKGLDRFYTGPQTDPQEVADVGAP